jgi:hypothetical protein
MRADPPGTYPRLTGQPAPGKKQPLSGGACIAFEGPFT